MLLKVAEFPLNFLEVLWLKGCSVALYHEEQQQEDEQQQSEDQEQSDQDEVKNPDEMTKEQALQLLQALDKDEEELKRSVQKRLQGGRPKSGKKW